MRAYVWRPLLSALLLILAGMALPPLGVYGHGTLDQSLTGDSSCTPSNFPSFVSSFNPLLQEFVPGASTLAGVDVCIGAQEDVPVELNIRSGTVANPGEVIASGSGAYQDPYDLRWVHIDLDPPIALEPGTKYILELPDSSNFAWWGTCGAEVFEGCPAPSPDRYPPGVPNFVYVTDFAFRTYTTDAVARQWGDVDCGGGEPTSVDALKLLRHVAALDVSRTPPCPEIETVVGLAGIGEVTWGDVDCTDGVSAVDALKVLRFVAGLSAAVAPPCPALGDEAELEP
jgi:hypothetical protein